MPSAAARVASTPELMELIFKETDIRTLLVSAQRVNKTWGDIIQNSHQVQRNMFFKPIAPESDEEIIEGRTINPLLAEVFPTFFKTMPKPGERRKQGGTSELNTWADKTSSGYDSKPFSFMDDPPVPRRSKRLGASISRSRREAFLRKGASWRNMLVQQPAAPHVGYIEVRGPMQRMFYNDIIKNKTNGAGVTMGMLYDMVYRFVGQNKDRSTFCVYWRDAQKDKAREFYDNYNRGEYGILADYPDDVGIAVIRHAYPLEQGQNGDVGQVSSLDKTYRPAGMQLYNPKLVCLASEDWFG
ncbi:f-box domain protein [Seiridium cupressi]